MEKEKKVVAILPAYNAAATITAFVGSLPKNIFDEIIVIDDASTDATYAVAKKLQGITLVRNSKNLGYGGNLKTCFFLALKHGADIIMELHPDGEYGIDGIVPAMTKIKNGADFVLGNRFAEGPRGMYKIKIIATKLLSYLDNIVFGTHIPDLHQGFRVYTKKMLESIDYQQFSHDYLFSFEMIAAAFANHFRVGWVPVTARYSGEKRGARWGASIRYTLATFRVRCAYLFGFYKQNFSLWYCKNCHIAYTYPIPKNMAIFYPKKYWHASGVLGWMKNMVFRIAQKRRVFWVKKYIQHGEILDVGSGSGMFGKQLGKNFSVTNIDPYYQGVGVIQSDFLSWKTTKTFDAIVFWESLEHTSDPKAYVEKAKKLLKPDGFLFIEYPRYGCLESRIFGRHWFHLDIPRHLVHFTDAGIRQLMESCGLRVLMQSGIWAFEYAPWGIAQSVVLWPFGCIIAWALYRIGQSPIGVICGTGSSR